MMNFKNMRMRTKLPLLMAIVTLSCLTVAGVVAYQVSHSLLKQEVENRLKVVGGGRTILLENWLDHIRKDIEAYSTNPSTIEAAEQFNLTFDSVDGDPKSTLQDLYIGSNPNPIGEKHLLDFATDGSIYSYKHSKYHPYFRNILEQRGYYDIFLINLDGDIVYSVFKELDFATSLMTGAYANSSLGKAFRSAIDMSNEPGLVFEDFAPYAPSAGAPASFVAKPIFNVSGEKIAVLAFQMPVDQLHEIIIDPHGLSPTTEIMVVADDGTSRSEEILGHTGGFMDRVEPNLAITGALNGESGVAKVTTATQAEYEVAFSPIDIFGENWAILVGEPLEVFLEGPRKLLTQLAIATGGILVIAIIVCFFVARSISNPLVGLARRVNKVTKGDYTGEIVECARRDELGGIARALRDLQGSLAVFHAGAQENLYKSSAFAGTSASMMITDSDFNITYANEAVMELLANNDDIFKRSIPGYSSDKIPGANMDIFHKDKRHARRILSDPSKLPFIADIALEEKRFSLFISAVLDGDGAVFGYVIEWKDVSKQRLNEAILKALDDNQCAAQFLADGKTAQINKKLCDAIGEDAEKYIGIPVDRWFSFDPDLSSKNGSVWDRLKSGQAVYGKFKIQKSDGEGWLEGGFSPVMGKNNDLMRVAFIGADRTANENAIIEATRAREEMATAQALVVDQLRIALGRMSEGDLTASIETEFRSDYEQLRMDFNSSVRGLLSAMLSVADTSGAITTDVASIAEAADDLSRRTEKQAATLEETAAALDQLTASVRQATAGAVEADRIVGDARKNAKASGEIVGETVEAMSKIEASSQQISKIISVIDDIAFQTNLLALNAGVEAARAGDAGRGFAVVASEVRALAQRSSEAAHEISNLITESTQHVQHGVRLVDRTGLALEEIVGSVGDISDHVSQIATSAQEQSTGLAEINTAVNQLDQTTQQNAAMFEETTAASAALLREANSLSSHVGAFNLGSGTSKIRNDEVTEPATQRPPAKAVAGSSSSSSSIPTPPSNVTESDGWEDF